MQLVCNCRDASRTSSDEILIKTTHDVRDGQKKNLQALGNRRDENKVNAFLELHFRVHEAFLTSTRHKWIEHGRLLTKGTKLYVADIGANCRANTRLGNCGYNSHNSYFITESKLPQPPAPTQAKPSLCHNLPTFQ
jgi:hypothetical protein